MLVLREQILAILERYEIEFSSRESSDTGIPTYSYDDIANEIIQIITSEDGQKGTKPAI